MRGLVMVFLFFAVIGNADARGGIHLPEMELVFSADVGILPSEHVSHEVTLRWGRTYWPLSEFGNCFAELRTPTKTSRTNGYWGQAIVTWKGEIYTAHCFNGPAVYLSKVKK